MISNNLVPESHISWFDVEKPSEDDFKFLSSRFNLPTLLALDTLHPEHLPKYEITSDGYFFIMRCFDDKSKNSASTLQELTRKITLFISNDNIITIHRVHLSYLNDIIGKAGRNNVKRTIQSLVHEIILETIRTYELPVLELQNNFDDFEEDILSKNLIHIPNSKIYLFRRKLFVIKRILKQTQDALLRSTDFWENHLSLLQDLKENIDHIYFQIDEIGVSFDHLFQLHVSINDQRANQVMKILTVFSTILLPLNFIASFYGMNFTALPGLNSQIVFHLVILIMLLMTIGAIILFKKKGWFRGAE